MLFISRVKKHVFEEIYGRRYGTCALPALNIWMLKKMHPTGDALSASLDALRRGCYGPKLLDKSTDHPRTRPPSHDDVHNLLWYTPVSPWLGPRGQSDQAFY